MVSLPRQIAMLFLLFYNLNNMDLEKVNYINRDNLHYDNGRKIHSFNKPFMIIISSRDPGKTSWFWCMAYQNFKEKGMKGILMCRQVVEITEAYLEDIENEINKFLEEDKQVKFNYAISTAKVNGYLDVFVEGELFFRVVALSIKMVRLKKMKVRKCGWIAQDEYIIDPRTQEKYLPNEAMRIKELYTTNNRTSFYEDKPIRMYILGNPYSLFNPLFVDFNVDTSKLKIGEILVGGNYVIDYYKMKQELRDFLLKKNPYYEFDEDYKGYALEGKPVNDVGLKIEASSPSNYHLSFVVRMSGKFIGVFKNNDLFSGDYYYCKEVDENYGSTKGRFAFDFKDLVEGTTLFSGEDKMAMAFFKRAIQKRKVTYSSVSIAYFIEELYQYI